MWLYRCVARRKEVETDSLRFQHPTNLGKRLVIVLHMLEHLIRDYEVEDIVCEGEPIRPPFNKSYNIITVNTIHIETLLEREVTAERLVAEAPVLFYDRSVSAPLVQQCR